MGQKISLPIEDKYQTKNLPLLVNKIAANYILTEDFQNLKKLSQNEYCEKVAVMTSKLLAKHLSPKDVTYLYQKFQTGNVVNQLKTEKLAILPKATRDTLDIRDGNVQKKRRICIGVAKYYVKIANLFAAIMSSVNPVVSYRDNNGNLIEADANHIKVPISGKFKIGHNNFCTARLNKLMRGLNIDTLNPYGSYTVRPELRCTETKLGNEQGFPELEQLYYDKYNYETGLFSGVSQTNQSEYNKDKNTIFKLVHGRPMSTDEQVKYPKMSDIKLNTSTLCSTNKETTTISGKNENFRKYINHIKQSIQGTKKKQQQLVDIVDKLFTYSQESIRDKETSINMTIHPQLTEIKLDSLISKARGIILSMYIECEENYNEGLKLFEAIVEHQIYLNTIAQKKNLR